MSGKISVWLLATGLLTNVFPAQAQQQPKVSRIGYLVGASLSAVADRVEAFRQGLRELGYVKGKTLPLNGAVRTEIAIASARSQTS